MRRGGYPKVYTGSAGDFLRAAGIPREAAECFSGGIEPDTALMSASNLSEMYLSAL